MPIIYNEQEVVAINYGSKVIAYIYKGAILVWQSVLSCFAGGYWVNTKRWINSDKWKNN